MEEKIFCPGRFLGLNENPDGDTKLKPGEASVCRNFTVTRDGNLRRRAGTGLILELCPGENVKGIWCGSVAGQQVTVCACGGKLWRIDSSGGVYSKTEMGAVDPELRPGFFGFSGKLYVLTGSGYCCWDGESFGPVRGYRPITYVAVPPSGGGERLEGENLLTGEKRVRFSPDGQSTVFILPEKDILSVDYIKDLNTGENIPETAYSVNLSGGKITFASAPAEGVSSLEAGWTARNSRRGTVEKMRFSELYNGTQDSRVFLGGDGSNRIIYSGLDDSGEPRADYFPVLNFIRAGEENEPVTGLIRHYSTLICFKRHSAWSVRYGNLGLADGSVTGAFYCAPVNRSIGCEAPGQVQLVENSPRTLHGRDLFSWKNNNSYSSNLTMDERQARRISDRVQKTLSGFDFARCVCFDDNYTQEYYISCGDKCLVENYACGAWYLYEGLSVTAFGRQGARLLLGDSQGRLLALSCAYRSDTGSPIEARWESGSMGFGRDWRRKLSPCIWLGIKPETRAEVLVSLSTDRGVSRKKPVRSSLAAFSPVNFRHWSFATCRRPRIRRIKLRAGKFVYCRLVLESSSPETTATVLASCMRVRFTGTAK